MVRYGSSVRARMREVRVRGYYRHERYTQETFRNDIAVLLLDQALKLSKKTKAIRISENDADLAGKKVIVAGWGRPEERASRGTENLRYTSQVVWPPNKCRRKLRSFNEEIHICAYGKSSATCKGDSGGPVMIRNGSNIEVVGLVSYGIGCNRKGVPSGSKHSQRYGLMKPLKQRQEREVKLFVLFLCLCGAEELENYCKAVPLPSVVYDIVKQGESNFELKLRHTEQGRASRITEMET
ncbi:hypothetical protein HPB47_007113 [Ixodes persulcatus]|uniref:Uncharacterized protein n=1 Tax=Ixodes persulcatus TaxID=34615 RepID=A0AC60P8H0_IXOPE|nr:hypothetical protein HPB47_007113 [Ixodes persulcatus]